MIGLFSGVAKRPLSPMSTATGAAKSAPSVRPTLKPRTGSGRSLRPTKGRA